MNEQYKIGDVSRLLGIPVQTLRYYEEQGIVHPIKNESTGYRYYDAWDFNSLMDSVYYRSLDFSLSQIQEMLEQDSIDEKLLKYSEQETLILHKIRQYNSILDVLSRQRRRLQSLRDETGVISIRKSPGLIFFRHRRRNKFQSGGGSDDFTGLMEGMKQWMDNIRDIIPTFIFEKSSLSEAGPDSLDYWWGWSLPVMDALDMGMEPVSPNEYIPSCRCIYTIFSAGDEGSFAEAFYNKVFRKIITEPYIVTGSPFGRLIIKSHEEGRLVRYFEIWIPIE